RCRVSRQEHVESLLATARRRKHVAKCDVRPQITVVVDVEPVDGIRMERVSIWICIEDDYGSRRVGRRQECVEIAQVESLVAKRRPEAQASKVVRHCLLLLSGSCRSVWFDIWQMDGADPSPVLGYGPGDLAGKGCRFVVGWVQQTARCGGADSGGRSASASRAEWMQDHRAGPCHFKW